MIVSIENTLGLLIYKSQKYVEIDLSEEIIDLFRVLRVMLKHNEQELLCMWRKYVETVQIKGYVDNFADEWEYTNYFTRHEIPDVEYWNNHCK